MKNTKKAFTVVELLIVIVIIGLLAAMGIPAFQKVKEVNRLKQAGLTQVSIAKKVYVISTSNNQIILESTLQGETYLRDGKVIWTDSEGKLKEHIQGPGSTVFISTTPPNLNNR